MVSGDPKILSLLEQVLDPEVPALSIVDLGIVRDARAEGATARVKITPTYSGCPAMDMIREEIEAALTAAGFKAEIETVLSPPWSSAWISARGREKLREYGIAPPQHRTEEIVAINPRIPCPFCGSKNTELRSRFGSTACKALHFCRACSQPFEYFKDF